MGYEYNIVCSKCGAEYEVYKRNIPQRDSDSEICEICGEELFDWSGGVTYTLTLVKKGNESK